ncbi:MAG: hypothetical protein ACM3X0_13945 [Bacteroidota bacterium]
MSRWLAIALAFLLLTGCGAPPTVRDSVVLAASVEKTGRLHFVYRATEMRTVSSYRYGQGAPVVDTGFDGFGQNLARQAENAFAARQVAVLSATVLGSKDALPVPASTGEAAAPVLLISPVSGTTQANRQSTRTSYVFSAHLMDPQSRRLLWKATIDTSTWAGQDFVMRNVEKTVYDDKYALQLLQAIVDKLGEAGLIR